MKYADRRGAPCAIIQGSNEKANGEVQIKDLIAGAGLTEIKDRDEYLRRQAEAQFAVKESELVEAVQKLLKRHKLVLIDPYFPRLRSMLPPRCDGTFARCAHFVRCSQQREPIGTFQLCDTSPFATRRATATPRRCRSARTG